MKISQIFGPTIQGEGAAAGRHCLFVRLYNCNLHCSWCDTAYTWADTPTKAAHTQSGKQYDRNDPKLGLKEMTVDQVLKEIDGIWNVREDPTIIVVSGGEPMLQQVELAELGIALRAWGNEVHVETAGTIAPLYGINQAVNQYNVSPKLQSSGNPESLRYRPEVLRMLAGTGRAWFKFVVCRETEDQDFKEIDKIITECGIRKRRVQVMPEGTDAVRNILFAQKIADRAIKVGYGLTFRSHILIWGDDTDK